MGDLIGSIVGGAGSLVGAGVARKAAKAGAQQALTGYNYLNNNKAVQGEVSGITGAESGARTALNAQSDLLNGGAAQKSAFSNYLGSTGFNFQRQQGQQAITGSAASRGLLGSGGTGKALAKFGNDLATTGFQNYFNNLGANAQGFGAQAGRGLSAADMTGQAGTTGGGNAGKLTYLGGQDMASADAAFGSSLGKSIGSAVGFGNFFGV